MRNTLITLAAMHYEFGLIGYDEFNERIAVARWLEDELGVSIGDPRNDTDEEPILSKEKELKNEEVRNSVETSIDGGKTNQSCDDENWLEFLCLGVWVFTKADPDSYPSIPHGHSKNQNSKWPKLNPYTGRVFTSKHQEDKKKRLTKNQMKSIWSDEKFKSFCREMIVWYREQFSYYEFSVRMPLRMPRW